MEMCPYDAQHSSDDVVNYRAKRLMRQSPQGTVEFLG